MRPTPTPMPGTYLTVNREAMVREREIFTGLVLSMREGARRRGNTRLVHVLSRDLRFVFPEAFLPKRKGS